MGKLNNILDIILAILYIIIPIMTIYSNYNLDTTNQVEVNKFLASTLTTILVGMSLVVIRILCNNKL